MMMYGWMSGWMLLWGLLVLALIVLAVVATVWLVRRMTLGERDDAQRALGHRYAAGEMDRDEYLRRRKDLGAR